ncbi:MAG TPA: isocitrate lyase/phosphoenolpyruvate mutase family protein [Myxococcota bacterium]|nr:isocitrate lyase/phosphoenolpyruvate mutase family protein [Myxococcota bacterium]
MSDPAISRATRFQALHQRPEPLLLPNPWDAGSARLLAQLGFEALATTSLGVANSAGRRRATAAQILENVRELSAATDLPLNADLENGFADSPVDSARMIAQAWEAGAAGGSIEDCTGNPAQWIYDFGLAVERVHAAAEAARALPGPFVLTARAEGLLYEVGGLDEVIRRLQAFERAGADVLYAPGLRTLSEMQTVVKSLTRPVNVVMGFADPSITLDQLRAIGVRRVSIGGGLSRLALAAFLDGAREMRAGRFGFVTRMAALSDLWPAFA